MTSINKEVPDLILSFMDVVTFNDIGNSITMIKYRNKPQVLSFEDAA